AARSRRCSRSPPPRSSSARWRTRPEGRPARSRRRPRASSTAPGPAPPPPLAGRTEVGGAPADHDPPDLGAAARAGLRLAGVDEELVLHRALLAARVAGVVDRRAAASQTRL